MKKEITLGQLLGVGTSLFIAIMTGWVTLNNQSSTNAAEIKELRLRIDKIERIEGKIDLLTQSINELALKVENKKDREK